MSKASQVWYEQGGGDDQWTPRETVELLLPHIKHLKDKIIWCPFDTAESQFVRVLQDNGYKVVYSHIETGQDFFSYEPDKWDIILSNPPYKDKRLYWERALSFGKPFALLLPVNILSDSIINATMKGREKDFQLLIPSRRTRFYNRATGKVGNQPTFKAAYFGVKFFKQQLILADLPNLKKEKNGKAS